MVDLNSPTSLCLCQVLFLAMTWAWAKPFKYYMDCVYSSCFLVPLWFDMLVMVVAGDSILGCHVEEEQHERRLGNVEAEIVRTGLTDCIVVTF